jgi:hypothetical protein
MRLTVSDGSLSSRDDVVITVGECTSGKLFVVSRQPGEQSSTNEIFRYEVSETGTAQPDLTIVHSSFDNAGTLTFTPGGELLVVSSGTLSGGPGLSPALPIQQLATFNGTITSTQLQQAPWPHSAATSCSSPSGWGATCCGSA